MDSLYVWGNHEKALLPNTGVKAYSLCTGQGQGAVQGTGLAHTEIMGPGPIDDPLIMIPFPVPFAASVRYSVNIPENFLKGSKCKHGHLVLDRI